MKVKPVINVELKPNELPMFSDCSSKLQRGMSHKNLGDYKRSMPNQKTHDLVSEMTHQS